jgi:hypothetical protein
MLDENNEVNKVNEINKETWFVVENMAHQFKANLIHAEFFVGSNNWMQKNRL